MRKPTAPPLFRAFIAYGDIPAARRAIGEIRDVLAASGGHCEFRPMLWRFDQLAKESWNEISLRDAADAMIIVLASTESRLPAELERWLGMLVARNNGVPLTIVAVLGATDAWTISIETPQRPRASKAPPARDIATPRRSLAVVAA